jgi:hypothetical protein
MLFCLNRRNDKWLSNKQDIKSKKQLPISHLYIETKQRPYECDTCSNDKDVFIITNFNLIQIY